jgi:flagellar protein FliO/FliZ
MQGETDLLRVVLSLAFVLALMGLLVWIIQKAKGSRFAENLKKGRRLQLVEQLYLDPRHRLLLVKRDGREHLMMLGPQSLQVVESFDAEVTEGEGRDE